MGETKTDTEKLKELRSEIFDNFCSWIINNDLYMRTDQENSLLSAKLTLRKLIQLFKEWNQLTEDGHGEE